MSNYKRPVICWGNDFTIKIELQQFLDGEFIDFNINDVKSLEVYLICSTHQQKIPLDWKIESGFDNVISCDVDYRLTHPNTSYGIGVEGIDKYDKHFRWYMTGKEGILIVPNTSGQNIPQDTEVVDLVGRVGWGISTDADLTNYYTKIEVNNLLDQKVDESELTEDYYDSETIDGLLEAKADTSDLDDKQDTLVSGQNIKTINNISLLGPGNIDIQSGSDQVQSDWAQTDTTDPSYIKHKPDLSQYATEQELNNYYDKGEVDGMLNNKVDTSTLNSDYYNKNTVNNLLDAKANTSDLSQVATSGSYNDLTNKPDLTQYATHSELNTKQDTLVSGVNIKSINNISLLGSGNIDIQGGSSYTAGKNIDITNDVISTTDDIDAGTITAEDIKIKEFESGTVHYTRWTDTPNRYLAQYALEGTEMRIGDQWYTYGNKGTLYVDTLNDGTITISYTEWEIDTNPPSWVSDWGYNPYKSTTTVNGNPVYGLYNPDTDSPDFFIYDADNYGINSMWVDYTDIPSEKPLTYWKIKNNGMYVETNNTTNATFAGDRQISIGTNNTFGLGANAVMIGDKLEGEYTGNQLIVGKYNKEKNSLFTVGNGTESTRFSPYEYHIDNDYTFTMWTEFTDEKYFRESGDVAFAVYTETPEWTQIFNVGVYTEFWHLVNDTNPYTQEFDLWWNDVQYFGKVIMQKDGNNARTTLEFYTDDQRTIPYNIFASSPTIWDPRVFFWVPWRRDAFFVTENGDVYIPYYQDKNNTFNLGETIYNLQNRPQAVQSNWNESDSSSLAYIQNKPDLSIYAQTANLATVATTGNFNDLTNIPEELHDYSKDYLTIVSLTDNNDITLRTNRDTNAKTIEVSTDDGATWTSYTSSTTAVTLATLNTGEKILLKGNNATYGDPEHYGTDTYIGTSTYANLEGNIMSLIYGDNFIGQTVLTEVYTFMGMFASHYVSAEHLILPATTLTTACYERMFFMDSSLTSAPSLPATTLAPGCYGQMFQLCTSLTTAPELPATTLAQACYNVMFNGCSSLTTPPDLPATTLAVNCYKSMFNGCSSLTTAPELPATTLASFCYESMFSGCQSLTTAPELPATTLATACYSSMFYFCMSLTTAPELPATTLATNCYSNMFNNCSSLNYIKCLATDISASDCTTNWVSGVAASGTFITSNNTPAWTTGTSGIPSGWNSYTEAQYEVVRHYEIASMVTSSTSGLKIEVVNAMPATPDQNTIYIIA